MVNPPVEGILVVLSLAARLPTSAILVVSRTQKSEISVYKPERNEEQIRKTDATLIEVFEAHKEGQSRMRSYIQTSVSATSHPDDTCAGKCPLPDEPCRLGTLR